MNKLTLNGTTHQLPSTWEELSNEQIVKCFCVILENQPLSHKVWAWLAILVKADEDAELIDIFREELELRHLAKLKPLTNFINLDDYSITRNPLPVITVPFGEIEKARASKLHGPAEMLSNISFAEWIRAEQYYDSYINKGDEQSLNSLVATLYRPVSKKINPAAEDFEGDIRETFNDHHLKARAEALETVHFHEKFAVFFFYRTCRSVMIKSKRYEYIFKLKETTEEKADPDGWIGVLSDLAGDDVTAIKPISETNFHTILYNLNRRLKQHEEQKEETERLRRQNS